MSKKVLVDLAMKLSADSAELRKGMEESKREMQNMRKSSEDVGKKITEAFAKVAAAVGAAYGAFKSVEGIMRSTQTTGDKLDQVLGSIDESMGFVQRSIANMDFNNFTEGIQRAYDAGREYVQTLDEIADRTRAIGVRDAKLRLDLANLENIIYDPRSSEDEKIAAIAEKKLLLEENINQAMKTRQMAYDAEIKRLQKLHDLTEQQAKSVGYLFENYDVIMDSGAFDRITGLSEAEEQLRSVTNQIKNIQTLDVRDQQRFAFQLESLQEQENELRDFVYFNKQMLNENEFAWKEAYVNITDDVRDRIAQVMIDIYREEEKLRQLQRRTLTQERRYVKGSGVVGAGNGIPQLPALPDWGQFWNDIDMFQFNNSRGFNISDFIKNEDEVFEPHIDAVIEKFKQASEEISKSQDQFNAWESIAVGAAQSVVDAFFNMAQGIEVSIESILKNLARMIAMQFVSVGISSLFAGPGGAASAAGGLSNFIPGINPNIGTMPLGLKPGSLSLPGMGMGGFKNGSLDINVHGFIGNDGIYLASNRAQNRRNIVEG